VQTVERYKSLLANSDVTAVDVADANVAVRLAEAAVGLAQVALEDRTIRAPIDGRLGLSDVEVGDRISAEQVIVTIDDTETLLIEFELPERSIGLLEKGRAVLANTPVFTGRTFEGEIVAFDSRLDSVTRSVTVRARIDNPDRKLWSGMTFAIRLIDEIEKLPAVPATAITWNREGSAVWTNTNGAASRVPVTILYREGDQVWIETAIAEGTPIVTEGAQKLREGGALLVEGDDEKPRPEKSA
jgi:RND family efflux transporter MFP subunit